MNEIVGYNDRCILLLLEHKKNKSKKEIDMIAELKRNYPDYKNHIYDNVELDLFRKEFLHYIDLRPDLPEQSESGYIINYKEIGIEKHKTVTTEIGITALNNNYYKSEMEEKARQKRLLILDRCVKWIAVIGGVLGFITFFKQLLS